MAGRSIRNILTQLTCRLDIQRGGRPVLTAAWKKHRFSLVLRHESNRLIISLTPTVKKAEFPRSRFFPREFFATDISTVFKQFVSSGKLTLSLVNYDAESPPDSMRSSLPPTMTYIFLSEAAPDALNQVLQYLDKTSIPKHDPLAIEESAIQKRQKLAPEFSLESLTFPMFSLIIQMSGEPIGRFRLINKWSRRAVDIHSERLSVRYAKSAPGEIVCRLISQKTGLIELNLAECSELTFSDLKNAPNLSLLSLKTLILKDCKRMSDSAVKLLISHTPLLATLDISGCRQLKDGLIKSLDPTAYLPNLLNCTVSHFSSTVLCEFLQKYSNLVTVRLDDIALTGRLLLCLQSLPQLQALSIAYTHAEAIAALPAWPCDSLSTVKLMSAGRFPKTNTDVIEAWRSVGNRPLTTVACEVPIGALSAAVKSSVEVLCATCVLDEPLPRLVDFTVYTDGYDLAECLTVPGSAQWLSSLRKLAIFLRSDFVKATIASVLPLKYPLLPYSLKIIPVK